MLPPFFMVNFVTFVVPRFHCMDPLWRILNTHRIHLWCGNAVNFFHFNRHTAQCSLLWGMGSRLFMAPRGEHTLPDTEFERLLLWRKLTKPVLDKYFEDVKNRILNCCNLQRTWISTLIHFVNWEKQTSLDVGIPLGQGRNFSLSIIKENSFGSDRSGWDLLRSAENNILPLLPLQRYFVPTFFQTSDVGAVRVGSPTGAMVEESWDFLHCAAWISNQVWANFCRT